MGFEGSHGLYGKIHYDHNITWIYEFVYFPGTIPVMNVISASDGRNR